MTAFSDADAMTVLVVLCALVGIVVGVSFAAAKMLTRSLPLVFKTTSRAVMYCWHNATARRPVVKVVNVLCDLPSRAIHRFHQPEEAEEAPLPLTCEMDRCWEQYDEPTYLRKGKALSF